MTAAASRVEARRAVRFTFWTGVFMLWMPLAIVGGLLLLWAAAAVGLWAVPALPSAPSVAAVRQTWGEPDEIVAEADAIRQLFAGYEGCPLSDTREVWFYDRLFREDSVVFVGNTGEVLCASPANRTYFFHRSH
jgi:hypothetical protein